MIDLMVSSASEADTFYRKVELYADAEGISGANDLIEQLNSIISQARELYETVF